MEYKCLLNEIYSIFKNNDEYIFNQNIKFLKENNTNIVDFEMNKENLGTVNGSIIEQNHLILIYFIINSNLDNYFFISKANISNNNQANIFNYLLKNDVLEKQELIERKFLSRKDLYNFDCNDIVYNLSSSDKYFDEIQDIINIDKKKILKRHKI